jgi:two-component system phosphate regulon sensor histidine kinase PhoR
MRLSLRLRIALSYSALLILVIGGLSAYVWIYVRNSYLDGLRSNSLAETRVIAAEVTQEKNPTPSLEVLQALADRFKSELNSSVTFILKSGIIAGDSNQGSVLLDNYLSRSEIQQALNGNENTVISFSQTLNQNILYSAVPIFLNGKVIGVARLAMSLATVDNAMADFSARMLLAVLFTIIAAIGLAFYLTNRVTQPLQGLIERISKLSPGAKAEITRFDNSDEIAQLKTAFDQLESRLNKQIEAVTNEQGTLSSVLNSMTDGVVIIDPEGCIQLINPAVERMFGVTAVQAINQSVIESLRHHQLVDLWKKCQETDERQSVSFETSPSRLYIQAIAAPLKQSFPGSTLLVLQDLTRLRRLEVIRRDFVSNVSHELRTPLAALKAISETLEEGALEDPPAARRFLLRMENEIDNLTQLVTELLELSRIESGKVPLKQAAVRPADLVGKAFERMELQAERLGLKMTFESQPDLPAVNIDSYRMEQVLVNLIHNAIKFTPPGGEILIRASQKNDIVIFMVSDTGVGISADALPRIFERFYKADRSRSGGGTGLGLSIARHLVEAHGGRIWAESEPGKGSSFYFSLPVISSKAAASND